MCYNELPRERENMTQELTALDKAVRAFKKCERKNYEADRAEQKLHDAVMLLTDKDLKQYVQRTSPKQQYER